MGLNFLQLHTKQG